MDKPVTTITPSWDRFRTVRLCRKLGIPFHELVNRRIRVKRNDNAIPAKKRNSS